MKNTLKRVIDHIIILNKAGCLFVFPMRVAQQRLWSCFLLRNVSIHLFILCLLIRPALHSCVRVSTLGVTVQDCGGGRAVAPLGTQREAHARFCRWGSFIFAQMAGADCSPLITRGGITVYCIRASLVLRGTWSWYHGRDGFSVPNVLRGSDAKRTFDGRR